MTCELLWIQFCCQTLQRTSHKLLKCVKLRTIVEIEQKMKQQKKKKENVKNGGKKYQLNVTGDNKNMNISLNNVTQIRVFNDSRVLFVCGHLLRSKLQASTKNVTRFALNYLRKWIEGPNGTTLFENINFNRSPSLSNGNTR